MRFSVTVTRPYGVPDKDRKIIADYTELFQIVIERMIKEELSQLEIPGLAVKVKVMQQ
jgi:hypothetical protein